MFARYLPVLVVFAAVSKVSTLTAETTTPTLSTEPTGTTAPSPPTTPASDTTTPPPGTSTGATTAVTTSQSAGTTISISTATTLSPVIVCPSVPCPLESVCLNSTCQCLSGNFLLNGRCVPAQVFPGRLHLTLTFQSEMSNRSSSIFQHTAANISAALREALRNQPGYIRSDVLRLEQGSVVATVNNIFDDTSATQESIDQSIKEAIANSNSLLANASFTRASLCEQEPFPCDVSTMTCTETNGRAACSCKNGYIPIIYSTTSCKACPSGQRAVGNTCEQCPFGYAGFNCNDSALLAVVVISCVLGGVLLILVLSLLIYCCWRRCSRKDPDSSSPYSSDDLNQPWPAGITPIPRASTDWDRAASIEMRESSSTHTLVDKKHQSNGAGFQLKQKGWSKSGSYDLNPEGMKTFKGKNTSRYSYLVQGHENPYFLPGDEKKN
ncbi:protein HEG homolog 1 isoform 4-T4 [Pholidichthys leucotaenia]